MDEVLREISQELKAVDGVNLEWINDFVNVTNRNSQPDLFNAKVENIVCTTLQTL